jgi:hypothetical protein
MTQRSSAHWWRDLDAILRRNTDGRTHIERSLWRLLFAVTLCGGLYGSFIGWFSVKSFGWPGLGQLVAAAVKVPMLFLLTLAVTFPSLYLFSALLDAPLGFRQTLRLLLTAILVTLAAAASFGPILGFFTVSTESYAFMLLLNVVLLGAAAVIGMAFLMVRLRNAGHEGVEGVPGDSECRSAPEVDAVEEHQQVGEIETEAKSEGALPPRIAAWSRSRAAAVYPEALTTARRGTGLLQLWVVIYGLVGVQMAWILRPFVGNPERPLSIFRPIGGSFFEGLMHALERFAGF